MTDTSREAFEAYAITLYKNISLEKDDGEYRYALASTGWKWWQASRKALEAEQAQAVEPVAWPVYVAEANNQYAVCDIDDAQLVDDCTNHSAEVTPLYAHPAPQPAGEQIDWQDMYLKAKSEKEAMASKYEKDIGPLARVVPVSEAQQVAVPEREPLSDEQIDRMWVELCDKHIISNTAMKAIARAIEAHHKIGAKMFPKSVSGTSTDWSAA